MGGVTGEAALAAMTAAMDGVAILDSADEFIYVNETHAELYGYADPASMEGLSWRRLYDAAEVERFESEVFPTLEEDGQWRGEAVGRTKMGDRFDQELSLSRLESGGLVCIVRDITARKRHERQLRLVQDASRELMHTTDETAVARVAVDIAEEILDHRMTACWTYDAEANQLTPLAATDAVMTMLADAGLEGLPPLGPESLEMEVFDDGEPVLIEDYQSAVRGTPETPLQTVLMLPIDDHGVLHVGSTDQREVTDEEQSLLEIFTQHIAEAFERTERERTLAAKNERLETFAATVAHDLRNPLGVARGRLQLAMTDDDAHLQAVAEAHERMEQLIDELLTLAEHGQTIVDPSPVVLESVAEDALGNVPDDGVALVMDDAPVELWADRSRLCELLENLLDNAVAHASDTDGSDADSTTEEVTIRIGHLLDATGFYVADDGPGIPASERDHVFDTGYTTTPDGTGFGLSIVEQICEGHGWSISVTESERGGARFEISNVELV